MNSEVKSTRAKDDALDPAQDAQLLALARESIANRLAGEAAPEIDRRSAPSALFEPRAAFVTLRRADGALRGCIGSLEAREPLVDCVRENAVRAAFHDPRFPLLGAEELDSIRLEISVLSPLEPIDVISKDALLASLRPGVDGLVIEDRPHRATFLPEVWNALPDPASFLAELLQKAGLPAGHWSNELRVWRYTAHHIE